jgi:hypothetical protein
LPAAERLHRVREVVGREAVAAIAREQPLQDLDRRRRDGTVRPEQAEAVAGLDLEVQPGDGRDARVAY